jgi:hypothetical protein
MSLMGCGSPALAAPASAGPIVIEADARVVAAARALGPDVLFFTAKARPLTTLALGDPAAEMGTGDLDLARPLLTVLRAGGVELRGGAIDLMQLVSEPHFSALFRENKLLRLFAVRARADGRERAIAETGGGLRVLLRARGNADLVAGAAEPGAPSPTSAATAPATTSFGAFLRVERGPTARHRAWDAVTGASIETRRAAVGRDFVVVHIARDFAAGEGLVSFLFGSGIVVKPAFERLLVKDATGARHAPAAIFADGRTLELGYELPARAGRLVLEDGDHELPLP